MLTEVLFACLVLAVAAQRLAELRVSKRHAELLQRAGAQEHARSQTPVVAALHTLWLVSMLVEVLVLRPAPRLGLSLAAGVVLAAGEGLRYAARRALGVRWCVRIFTLPGAEPVTSGVFRYLRHPNYLGVVLEILALPLVHSAFFTAFAFSAANAVWLAFRIRAEERALAATSGYREALTDRPRLWPTFRARGLP